ncbi:phosphotransferase [Kribbella sp. DT2]|uniref:phosphotransferase n=1 Tax=Kribbella sp. DT2 TaxID=3393427 RepID=UPI003CF9D43A
MAEAESAVREGHMDLADLDAENAGLTADQLVNKLHSTRAQYEDLVVTHGDLCLDTIIVDGLTVTLIDVPRLGRADRHQDLALLTRDLAGVFADLFTAD